MTNKQIIDVTHLFEQELRSLAEKYNVTSLSLIGAISDPEDSKTAHPIGLFLVSPAVPATNLSLLIVRLAYMISMDAVRKLTGSPLMYEFSDGFESEFDQD